MDERSEDEVRRQLVAADAAYEPFAPFSEWAAEPVGLGSWDDAAARLADVRSRTPVEAVRAALGEVLRSAAVDTGAIEGLYAADRGFTHSVAHQLISLDQAEAEAGPGFRRNYEAQMAGFELALQLAMGDEVITEAAVRELHRVTCAGQDTYRVLTSVGWGSLALPLGAYKVHPNHVQVGDGSFHSYAPVDRVPEEMHRLVTEMRSEEFLSAPAVVQAAFTHHAFVAIHPFADGNGRVARLLASVWLLRAASIPLWVETADRPRYIDALDAANQGDRQPFLRLVTSLSLNLLRELALVLEQPMAMEPSLEAAAAVEAAEVLTEGIRACLSDLGGAAIVQMAKDCSPHAGSEVPPGGAMRMIGNRVVSEREVFVGVDRRSDTVDRFLVLVFASDEDEPLRRERFALDEMVPRLTSSARRRLAHLAELIVTEARRPFG